MKQRLSHVILYQFNGTFEVIAHCFQKVRLKITIKIKKWIKSRSANVMVRRSVFRKTKSRYRYLKKTDQC